MKLRFTSRATQDITDIADYIRLENPAAALRVRDAILETLQHLIQFPQLGRPQSIEGVRRLVTRRYGYIVYYSVDQRLDEVVILAVQHPARERDE